MSHSHSSFSVISEEDLDGTLTSDRALNFPAIPRGLEHKWLSSSVDP